MLTILIGLLYIFLVTILALDGEWGIVAGLTVVLVILILMADGDRRDTKAWLNMRDYWASGGPKNDVPYEPDHRAVTRNVVVNVVQEPAERVVIRSVRNEPVGSDTEMGRLFGTSNTGTGTFVCPSCCRMVRTACRTIHTPGGVTREYWCPNCRKTVRVSF